MACVAYSRHCLALSRKSLSTSDLYYQFSCYLKWRENFKIHVKTSHGQNLPIFLRVLFPLTFYSPLTRNSSK